MKAYYSLVLLLSLAPLGTVVAHAIIARVVRYSGSASVAPQVVVLATIGLCNCVVLAATWGLFLGVPRHGALESWCSAGYVFLTYNGFAFFYCNVFNASETSLHVHILMMLLIEGPVPEDKLMRKYGAQEMINVRIDRMIGLGQLKRQGEYYVLESRGLVVVGRAIAVWRRILRLPTSPAGR